MVTDDSDLFRLDNLQSEVARATCGNALLTRALSKCLLATLAGGVINQHMVVQACISGASAAGFALLSKCQFPTQRTCASLCKPRVSLLAK